MNQTLVEGFVIINLGGRAVNQTLVTNLGETAI